MKVRSLINTLCLMLLLTSCREEHTTAFEWESLPPVPDTIGFAGSFAGISNDALIVAGGANFPDGGVPWLGSLKVWHDDIFILENPGGTWKSGGKLPFPLAYGVSVSAENGLVLIGGSDRNRHYADVMLLEYRGGDTIETTQLPALPKPLANAAGVLMGKVIYIMGGTTEPSSKEAENIFWSLDLGRIDEGWKNLPSWPGPARMLPVAGTEGKSVYLFSGAHLKNGKREYLKDAYKYSDSEGWQRITDLPRPVVAAPGPAFTDEWGKLIIFGGDDGSLADSDPQEIKHPGFSKAVLSYDSSKNTWLETGMLPDHAAVTTPLVVWGGKLIIPGGEIMPAVRTTGVMVANPVPVDE